MSRYHLLLIILLVQTCDIPTQTNKNNQDKEFTNSVDFSNVDSYPKFLNCKELLETDKEADCFSKKLNSFLDRALKRHTKLLEKMNTSKMNLHISISREGRLKIDSATGIDTLRIEKNKMLKNINEETSNLNIKPALKRGIPVKVHFKTPVNIKYAN